MRVDVPLFVQGPNECGPTSLEMILSSFGEDYPREMLCRLAGAKPNQITFAGGLLKAAAKLGHKAQLYIAHYPDTIPNTPQQQTLINRLDNEAKRAGGEIYNRRLPLQTILRRISKDCLAIALLDWNTLEPDRYDQAHFVPIVGYTKRYVYIHDCGQDNPMTYLPLTHAEFERARKNPVACENILFIHRGR